MHRKTRFTLALCIGASIACSSATPGPPASRHPPRATDGESFALMEASVIVSVNQRRRAAKLRPLFAESRLARAARLHAVNMAARRELSHTLSGVTTSTLVSRVIDVGYAYTAIAENLAYGPEAVEPLVDGWMLSAGHRDNILNPLYTETGVGIARSRDGVLFYCQVFGRPASDP